LIQTLTRNWWLLGLCGVLDAAMSVIYFIMQGTDGPVIYQSWNGTIAFLGKLTLAAGACTVAAGLWRSKNGKCWLLALNGLALGALGLIYYAFVRFRIGILTVALLIVLMAISAGILELGIARTLRRRHHVADGSFLALAGVASIGFALPFLALGFRWIRIEPGSHPDLLWLGAYFGFSAVCMLGLALRLPGSRSPVTEYGDAPAVG
jgi:uncharacterized membrane protein HdeD (DUF308 family)